MVPAQVYAHPAFECIEMLVARALGGSVKGMALGYDGGHWAARLVLRSIYVLLCGLVAVLIPFFGDLMGLVGALGEWRG